MTNPGSGLKVTTPSDREIAMTRVFDAPRHLVFEAYTRPELLKRWLGVHNGWSLAVCEIDLRVGGSYRYLWRGPDGVEMGMRGVYREVTPPERLVATEVFDQSWYEGEGVGTVTMVEQGGRTTLTIRMCYDSREVRDAVLKSPMEKGVAIGFDNLAELLAISAQGTQVTIPMATTSTPPRRPGRSAAAVLAGFVAVVALSLGTDQVLHMLQVYPPWGQPMRDPGLNLLALAYRLVYGVVGSYITARLAPHSPMRHVWIGAAIGFVLSSLGAIAAIRMDMGPAWYPIALALSAWPTAWVGGMLYLRRPAA